MLILQNRAPIAPLKRVLYCYNVARDIDAGMSRVMSTCPATRGIKAVSAIFTCDQSVVNKGLGMFLININKLKLTVEIPIVFVKKCVKAIIIDFINVIDTYICTLD